MARTSGHAVHLPTGHRSAARPVRMPTGSRAGNGGGYRRLPVLWHRRIRAAAHQRDPPDVEGRGIRVTHLLGRGGVAQVPRIRTAETHAGRHADDHRASCPNAGRHADDQRSSGSRPGGRPATSRCATPRAARPAARHPVAGPASARWLVRDPTHHPHPEVPASGDHPDVFQGDAGPHPGCRLENRRPTAHQARRSPCGQHHPNRYHRASADLARRRRRRTPRGLRRHPRCWSRVCPRHHSPAESRALGWSRPRDRWTARSRQAVRQELPVRTPAC